MTRGEYERPAGGGEEREVLGGRAAESDMWNLSSDVDPLCFHIFVVFLSFYSPSIHFFFIYGHFFFFFFFFSVPSSITFHDLMCDVCTPHVIVIKSCPHACLQPALFIVMN